MSGALQAIVFDFDGVIADSEPLHLRAFQHTLADIGVTLSAEDYYGRYLGYDDVGVFVALARDRGVGLTDQQVSSLVEKKGAHIQELLRAGEVLFPGAADFIRQAAAAVPIAIASGAQRHEIEEILEATQGVYGYLPVAALKRISQKTGAWYAMIYGTATYYGHLRFEPAEDTEQAAAIDRNRPPEASYVAALGASLAGVPRGAPPAA